MMTIKTAAPAGAGKIARAISMPAIGPFRLAPKFSERVWGRPDLKPWYAETGTKELVGEAWLTGPACVIETGPLTGKTLHQAAEEFKDELLTAGAAAEFPLLVKMLFPNDKLSVQVHPDDAQAQAMGQPRGKTECWYVLEAEPGAEVALGMRPGTTPEIVAASVKDGSMESLMEMVPVTKGDMIFVDAGTVHAIGPGVVLLETQQTCDVTYRLYDYGRPRELHLEQGLGVMKMHTAAGKIAPVPKDSFTRLIEQHYFVVDRYDLAAGETADLTDVAGVSGCVVSFAGSGVVTTDAGTVELLPAQAVVVPATAGGLMVRADTALSFLRAFEPMRG